MAFLLNIIWFILGGEVLALGWLILSLLFYITIIGAPIGMPGTSAQKIKIGVKEWITGKESMQRLNAKK